LATMQVIKINIIIFVVSLLIFACIEPYTPDIEEYRDLMVINGRITNQEGYQTVDISRTSSYNDPARNPESGCDVKVYDDRGHVFEYAETSPGYYICWIDKEYLLAGTRYRLEVVTGEGTTYRSAYDIMNPCAEIDTIYYEISEEFPLNPLLDPYPGLQFFIDTRESPGNISNFRWELIETWEYHSTYAQGDYYDGEIHFVEPEDYADSLLYCWHTTSVKEIFTMSTRNFASNKITRGFLNFVSNKSDRLSVKYSLLVKQYSLSDTAYEYWSQMQRLVQESGGLYETQPIRIAGNIRNPEDPDETVLGFFWASAVKEKRVFYKRNYAFPVYEPPCEPYGWPMDELMQYLESFGEEYYPIFLINLTLMDIGPWDIADQLCFDCTKSGGTTTRPDFW
jgi:hypothetical protein